MLKAFGSLKAVECTIFRFYSYDSQYFFYFSTGDDKEWLEESLTDSCDYAGGDDV